MKDLIVKTDIVCVDNKGEKHPITVEIGRPQSVGQDFACHVALHGLHDNLSPIMGADEMQAIVLAIAFVKASLDDLEKKKYRIVYPDDPDGKIKVTEVWFSSLGKK